MLIVSPLTPPQALALLHSVQPSTLPSPALIPAAIHGNGNALI